MSFNSLVVHYSEVHRRVVEYIVDYKVYAESKEDADRIIKEATSISGVDYMSNPNIYFEDEEVIKNVGKNYFISLCDDDSNLILSEKDLLDKGK